LRLDEVTPLDMLDFFRQRLGARIRKDLVERIVRKSDGSPLYLELIAQQLERGMWGERDLEMFLAQSLPGLYEARTGDLELRHPEMRKRLASLVRAIATQGQQGGVGLEEAAAHFSFEELASMEASGLFVVKHEQEKTIVSVLHASILDFLRQRYALS
jgi:hypothetical protein